MTTLTSIINSAFREGGIVAVGDTPDTAESAEALPILCNLISSVYTDEVGEFLVPYNLGDNGITYAPDYHRVLGDRIPLNSSVACNLTAAKTVYLDPMPRDGSLFTVFDASGNFATNNLTIKGNGRKISGSTSPLILNTNSVNATYIHNQGVGWAAVTTLSLGTDVMPFAAKYDDLFIMLLAARLNPRYGTQSAPETIDMMKRLRKQFRNQYRHTEEVYSEDGITRLPSGKLWNETSNFGKGS